MWLNDWRWCPVVLKECGKVRIYDIENALNEAGSGVVCLWSYSISLEEMVLRVAWKDLTKNMHIVCNGVLNIKMDTKWWRPHLTLSRNPEGLLMLSDAEADMCAIFRSIRVFENVEPLYLFQ